VSEVAVTVNKAGALEVLDVSERQLEHFLVLGMPSTGKGKARKFNARRIRRWQREYEKKLARDAAARERPADFEKARAEKLQAEAEIKKLELARLRRELIDVSEAARMQRADHERAAAVIRGGLSEFMGDGLSRELLERIAAKVQRAMVEAADDIEPAELEEDAA
jgi:phage terminase Nu1 subunit (DNA packaging protein)